MQYNTVRGAEELNDVLKDFIDIHGYGYHQIGRICLTGIRASGIGEDIHKIATFHVDEIRAIARGGLALSGFKEALIVNMGTGTTFVFADSTGAYRHIGGTGVGGGSLKGLIASLFDKMDFESFLALASQGDLNKVDLYVKDFFTQGFETLPPALTTSNLGKLAFLDTADLKDTISKADLAAGFINLILQVIGSMALMATESNRKLPIVLTGCLSVIPQVKEVFGTFKELYGMESVVPENAVYATAIGASV